jgi:hypothetical protein
MALAFSYGIKEFVKADGSTGGVEDPETLKEKMALAFSYGIKVGKEGGAGGADSSESTPHGPAMRGALKDTFSARVIAECAPGDALSGKPAVRRAPCVGVPAGGSDANARDVGAEVSRDLSQDKMVGGEIVKER